MFNKKNYNNYQVRNWPKYRNILKSNGNVLKCKHTVGKNGWRDSDDWMWGDAIWYVPEKDFGGKMLNIDLKTCGRYGATVKESQLTNESCKIDFFDFFDIINQCVYRISMQKLRQFYDDFNWYQNDVDANDKKNGLIRFNTETIRNSSIIFKELICSI